MAAKRKQVKAALVGCGRYGLGVYAPALATLAAERAETLELTAACDADPAKAQQACDQFGFANACDDVAAMIRDHAPTACILALPADETVMQGSQLLVQNMPCLFELPLGDSLDEAVEMSDAAGEMNTLHAVAMNRRANPYLVRAVRWAQQLGAIETITCTLTPPHAPDAAYMASTVAHAVDAVAFTLGRLETFTTAAEGDSTTVVLPAPNGGEGRIVLAQTAPSGSEVYEIRGRGFRAVATVEATDGPSLLCWRGETMEVNIASQAAHAETADGTYQVLAEFIGCLLNGQAPAPTIDDAVAAVDLAAQIASAVLQTATS